MPVNKRNNDCFDKGILARNSTENLHYRYLKMLLGVTRKTSSWAASTEFGRFPITVKAFTLMCKFYSHLSVTKSPILKAALSHSISMAGINVNSWFQTFTRVLEVGKIQLQGEDFLQKWKLENEVA